MIRCQRSCGRRARTGERLCLQCQQRQRSREIDFGRHPRKLNAKERYKLGLYRMGRE
jgi:hypothetical protein